MTYATYLMMAEGTGKEVLKWVVLIGSAPLWLPFAKALWDELKLAMREDGGLFGPEPGRLKRRQIHEQIEREESRVVSETLAHKRSRTGGAPERGPRPAGQRPQPGSQGGGPGNAPGGGVRGPRRRGFR